MRLNLISRWELWKNEDLKNDVNVPASVPAFLEIEKSGLPFLTTSGLLRTEDYHHVWDKSFLTTWNGVRQSLQKEPPDGPNIILAHAYSLFVMQSQVLTVERFLEICAERHGVDSIRIESPESFPDNSSLVFEGLQTAYYHVVAVHWARQKGLTHSVISNGRHPLIFPPQTREGSARKFRAGLIFTGESLISFAKISWYFLRGGRRLIFYTPFATAGLPSRNNPGYAVNIKLLFNCLALLDFFLRGKPANGPTDPPVLSISEYHPLVQRRLTNYLKSCHPAGSLVFHRLLGFLTRLRQRGIQTGYASITPFRATGMSGYIAGAFRKAGCPVASVQHGGNSRLAKRGGLGTLFADLLETTFVQWGHAATDEHTFYGVPYPVRSITTGSPWMRRCQTKRTIASGRRPSRILYAPTALTVESTPGNNIVWDRYIQVFRAVCAILNDSEHECVVKTMSTPEMSFFGPSGYPRLKFLREGGFVQSMWDADYLVVDSLGGSPIYEGLVTDKPILLYTGIENQEWDEAFLARLKESVVCFFDPRSYLDGLKEFVAAPEVYLRKAKLKPRTALVQDYLTPVSPRQFWASLKTGLFRQVPTDLA